MNSRSNAQVCLRALSPFGGWETRAVYRGDVAEAKRRRLTPERCAALLGKVVETAATSPPAEPERPTRAVARASRDTTGPVIEIPSGLTATASGEYEIAGRVTDESGIAEVRLQGKVIPLLPGGRFRVTAYAALGTSRIEIEAIDVWNNRASRTAVVTRAAPAMTCPASSLKRIIIGSS